jgi:hypothetical protein
MTGKDAAKNAPAAKPNQAAAGANPTANTQAQAPKADANAKPTAAGAAAPGAKPAGAAANAAKPTGAGAKK